jgi:hypothetical protein
MSAASTYLLIDIVNAIQVALEFVQVCVLDFPVRVLLYLSEEVVEMASTFVVIVHSCHCKLREGS